MDGYVAKALHKLQHKNPKSKQDAPHKWTIPAYGKRSPQIAPTDDTSAILPPKEKTRVQSIVGLFLYYGRAVDLTILTALNDIGIKQSAPTKTTKEKTIMLLDYLASHPNAKIRFKKSRMQLMIDTDAAYLVAPGAKSRIGGYFYLGCGDTETVQNQPPNAPVHVECTLLKNIVASAAEAETGGIFNNCQIGIHIKRLLEVLGHQQRDIPVKTDNATACAFANNTFRQKRSKAWDMRYNWIRDQTANKTFKVYWMEGLRNWADYFTKHHAPRHYREMRPKYLQTINYLWHDKITEQPIHKFVTKMNDICSTTNNR